MSNNFILDEYGCLINCKKNFLNIAIYLSAPEETGYASTIFAWSDEEATTQYDILIAWSPYKVSLAQLQGGIKSSYLFVSIMRVGAFAFRLDQEHSAAYVSEKLFINSLQIAQQIADLINGINAELKK